MAPLPVMPDEAEVAAEIYRYTAQALTCGGRVPRFGSPEWAALDDADPAKHAAVVRAALAHWGACQVEAQNHMQASLAISKAHDWAGEATRHMGTQVAAALRRGA